MCFVEFKFNQKYKSKNIKLPFKFFDCPDIRIHPNTITFLFNESGEFLVESELIDL